MKILFFINHDGFIRNFEGALEGLTERGHLVHLALTWRRDVLMSAAPSIDALAAANPRITYDQLPKARRYHFAALAGALYGARDYVRYLAPEYAAATKLRERARGWAPPFFRSFVECPGIRSQRVLRLVDRLLASVIRRLPTNPSVDEYVRRHAPDVALFTPIVGFGPKSQHGLVQSAKRQGVPTALLVHSWDNLTNKGLIHEIPDRVVVWNDDQKREAVELHGVPEEHVVVVGAHSYDHWFASRPVTTRDEFCLKVGLDPSKPFLLYVCSSLFIAPEESIFVAKWVRHLRSSGDPRVRDVGILVRPHPQNERHWEDVVIDDPGRTALWPRPGSERAGTGSRADYYDSIHHCAAVVGINTSAQIESAIQERPVFTVLAQEFRATQEGTLHFGYLRGEDGLLTVARDLDEHVRQLGEALTSPAPFAARAHRFVERFVRPTGIDRPATPQLLDAIESFASLQPRRQPRPRFVPALLFPLARITQILYTRRKRASNAAAEVRAEVASRQASGLRILFSAWSINYDRLLEAAIRTLLERDHTVHVLFEVEKLGRSGDPELFEQLRAEYPQLSWGPAPKRVREPWERLVLRLRLALDYLRYLEPGFDTASASRERAARRAGKIGRLALTRPFRGRRGRRLLRAALGLGERAAPLDPAVDELLARFDPDLVLVSPLVVLGSPQGEYIRAARRRGVPSALLVASWDNLTNKGIVRDIPDLTLVWNESQKREAVELHGIPPEKIAITGAHSYDHWFGWRSSTTREEFCGKLGLNADRPYILYVCSSIFIAKNERPFVERWVQGLRAHPTLRDIGVVIRPHPANAEMWADARFEDGRTLVFPSAGAKPTNNQRKAEYYDSIYHAAAVVGINTSALIESGIVGRPVLSLLSGEYRRSQEDMLHFSHLCGSDGRGLLTLARSFEEHAEQLVEAIERGGLSEPGATFIATFVRPCGLERPAAPLLADRLELVAATRLKPQHEVLRYVVARFLLALGLRVVLAVRWLREAARLLSPKQVRRAVRQADRDGREPLHLVARAHWRLRMLRRRILGVYVHLGGARRRLRRRWSARPLGLLRILFVLDHPGLLLHFDETVNELTRRGHTLHLAFVRPEKSTFGLANLAHSPNLVLHLDTRAPSRTDWYARVARGVRRLADYLHYLDPSMAEARYARSKWREMSRFPPGLRWCKRRETAPRLVVRALLHVLALLEEATPVERSIHRFVADVRPDLVLVSPLVDSRTDMTDYVKSARWLGIPSALSVASWDNLSSKGLVRIGPDRITVWNETQKREAVLFHRLPADRVIVTGSQPHDRWFGRTPSTTREEFAPAHGLPGDKPFVLYVGSTRQSFDEMDEPELTLRWVEALRAARQAEIRGLAVLIRPHPTNSSGYDRMDFSVFGDVVVWRRHEAIPIRESERASYFDALYHSAAVVGLNSSAMIEAAIVGRPVHVIRLPFWSRIQDDLIHFAYMREERGGFLREARALEEHVDLLAGDLRDPGRWRPQQERFVASFIRPRGIENAATPLLADAIEEAGRTKPATARAYRPWLAPFRAALVLYVLAERVRLRWLSASIDAAERAKAGFGARARTARLPRARRVYRTLAAVAEAQEARRREALGRATVMFFKGENRTPRPSRAVVLDQTTNGARSDERKSVAP